MGSNAIYQYYQKIEDGSIIVGEWIKSWYKIVIQGLETKLFYFDQKAANHVIDFVEKFCRHHEGALAPELIKLELWQKAFLSVVFGIKDKGGNRQFREVMLVIGRKNGKTLLAAAIAAYCAYKDGEYGGRIYMAAPKLQQANICFDAFYQMVRKEPLLDKRAKKRRTDIYIESSNSSIAPLAFNYRKSDGLNISLCIADEVASWHGDAGLKFYEVLRSSFGARQQPLLLNITTAGYENDSAYDALFKRCTRLLKGNSTEQRLAPFLYTIDDVDKWNDIDELAKANPNLGVSISVDYLLEEIRIAEGSLSKRSEAICKYANIKQSSSQAWLPANKVADCSGEPINLEEFRDCYAVCGIDLSRTTDLTAAVCCIERDGVINVVAKFYMPREKLEEATARDGLPYRLYVERGLLQLSGENFIDYHDCFEWMRSLINDYHIYPLQTGYDRYCAQYLIQDLNSYGFHTDDVYQGFNLSPVIREAEGLIKDGRINIGDNDLLKIHLLNSALQFDGASGKCRLVKIAPSDHIDGMAALLDALTVRQKWYDQLGGQLKNER